MYYITVDLALTSVVGKLCLGQRRWGIMRRMTVPAEKAAELLKHFDDPLAVQRPTGFNEEAVEARFEELLALLSRAFRCQVAAESGAYVQDASFYGEAVIPAGSTETGADIAVRVSNFGTLAVYGLELLGTYTDAEREVLMSPVDRDRVETALTDSGYVALPEDALWEPYDGANQWLVDFYAGMKYRPTWFIRFFDYI
jgi:hypothetical protein